jgi:hypothetical protein
MRTAVVVPMPGTSPSCHVRHGCEHGECELLVVAFAEGEYRSDVLLIASHQP